MNRKYIKISNKKQNEWMWIRKKVQMLNNNYEALNWGNLLLRLLFIASELASVLQLFFVI